MLIILFRQKLRRTNHPQRCGTIYVDYLIYNHKCLNRAYGVGMVEYILNKTYPFIR